MDTESHSTHSTEQSFSVEPAWELGIQGTKEHCGLRMERVGGLRWSGSQLGTGGLGTAWLEA